MIFMILARLAIPAVLTLTTWISVCVAAEAKMGEGSVKLVPTRSYTASISGDPSSEKGASVELRGPEGGAEPFGSTISEIDIQRTAERVVVLSANLSVDGTAQAILWLRIHDTTRRIIYANTSYFPVEQRDSRTERQLVVNIPKGATKIYFGVAQKGGGVTQAAELRIRFDPRIASRRSMDADQNLQAMISAVKANALNAESVSWADLQPSIAAAKRAEESYLNYPLYREILAQLGDRHSYMLAPHESELGRNITRSRTPFMVESIEPGIGYVNVPAIWGADAAGSKLISDEIQSSICRVSSSVKHWIVDLRANSGGNMWPMLRALSVFLGESSPGAFVDGAGQVTPWLLPVDRACDLTTVNVAVLVGPRTSSSGELAAIAFIGRPHTKVFGGQTSGRATSNRSIYLPDGVQLLITNARAQDRGGAIHEIVNPDHIISDEAALDAAKKWFMEKH